MTVRCVRDALLAGSPIAVAGRLLGHFAVPRDRCGRVIPFADEGLERELRRVSDEVEPAVLEHEVILRGACERCASTAAKL